METDIPTTSSSIRVIVPFGKNSFPKHKVHSVARVSKNRLRKCQFDIFGDRTKFTIPKIYRSQIQVKNFNWYHQMF